MGNPAFAAVFQASNAQYPTKIIVFTSLFTAAATIAGIVLKDLIFKILEERRAERRAELAVYERYSKPLAASAVGLLHRLHEMLLQEHRPVFLRGVGIPKATGQGSSYRAYKKLSTVYRLAAVLGLIRACRREFSYLRLADRNESNAIHDAINKFENAFADGSWVERQRVMRLCEILRLPSEPFEASTELLESAGVRVDNLIYDSLEAGGVTDLPALTEVQKRSLCADIAGSLATDLNTNPVSPAVMESQWKEAYEVIGMREAWVYRDWQTAIGDMMLRSSEGETRKFEVIGYGEFEQMHASGGDHQQTCIARLCEVLDDVNLEIEDRFDARPRQLRTMAVANANLILALHRALGPQTIITDSTLNIAKLIVSKGETWST
jgi:hypothetical protein